MKFFFARFCGHTTEIRDLEDKLHRTKVGNRCLEGQLKRAKQDHVDREEVIELLINAKRVAGLNHSGPALARHRIDQAITLLREGK